MEIEILDEGVANNEMVSACWLTASQTKPCGWCGLYP